MLREQARGTRFRKAVRLECRELASKATAARSVAAPAALSSSPQFGDWKPPKEVSHEGDINEILPPKRSEAIVLCISDVSFVPLIYELPQYTVRILGWM